MGIDKQYRLYVFDLDGTIVDTREDIALAFAQTLEQAGYPRPELSQVTSAIGGGAKKALQRLTGLQDEESEPLLAKFLVKYGEVCAEHAVPYEGARELLECLAAQGAVLALVTMKVKGPTHKILNALGLTMFDEVIAYEDAQRRKPDPETLLMLMEKYGVRPEDALMVGDAATDIRYAAAAGVDACAMLNGYGAAADLLAENPKYTLNSFKEF